MTRNCIQLLLSWFAVIGISVKAPRALATEKIYRVEMIVFKRHLSGGNDDAEGWQKNVLLAYPEKWQPLIDPREEAERRAQEAQEESLRLSDDFLQTLAEERQSEDRTQHIDTEEAHSDTVGVKYFEYLPADARNLRQSHNALVRRNLYRVLFHEAWVQPLGAPEKSPALILHGGKRYGDHYELQGYIHLGVSRFLHIQTDLWLSEFSVNHGQENGLWPQLPLGPHMVRAEDAPNAYRGTQETYAEMVNLTTERSGLGWEQSMDDWSEAKDAPYLVNNISILRQKRRMRSGELHYLDHPRFGVLIKITPQ